jgi:hypothetical protein
LKGGHDLDLDEGTEGEGGDLNGGTSGFVVAESLGVEGIDFGEIGHVGEKDGGFDDGRESEALGGEEGGDVGEDLTGLAFDIGGVDFSGGGIDGDLAGAEEEAAVLDSLGVGADGGGDGRDVIDETHDG